MSGRKNIIDKAFGKKLKHYQDFPPEDVWAGIEDHLRSRRRKKRMAWMSGVAAVLIVMAGTGITLRLIRQQSAQETVVLPAEEGSPEKKVSDDDITPAPSAKKKTTEPVRQSRSEEALAVRETVSRRTSVTPEMAGEQEPAVPRESAGREKERYMAGLTEREREHGEGIPARVNRLEIGEIPYQGDQRQRGDQRQPEERRPRVGQWQPEMAVRAGQQEAPGIHTGEKELVPDKQKRKGRSWSVGTQFSPVYSYRLLAASSGAVSNARYNEAEQGTVGYAGGFNVGWNPAGRLSLATGFYLAGTGIRAEGYLYPEQATVTYGNLSSASNVYAFDNSIGNVEVPGEGTVQGLAEAERNWAGNTVPDGGTETNTMSPQEAGLLQQFRFLEIPLMVRYKLIDRRMDFHVLGGVSTNLLVDNDNYVETDDGRERLGETTGLNKLNLGGTMGIGMEYAISDQFLINLEPRFNYYLNSINAVNGLKPHPYHIGVYTGMFYRF